MPVGVSLSGGLDSSVVTAFVAANHARVLGITFGNLDSPESEARLARQLADRVDVDLAFVDLTPKDFERALLETVRAQEAPFASASVMAQNLVFECGRRNGLTVMLGGQGGDEAFMGYRKYFMFAVSRGALRRHRPVEAARAIGTMLPMLVAERHAMGDYWWNFRHRYRSGFEPLVLSLPPVGGISLGDDGTEADSRARQIKDIERSSLPTLLRYEDRNSMWSSIESCLPFMDHRLIELAIALPDRLKLHNGYGKWIVRELAGDRVPDEIRTARYKRGFDVSFATWIDQGFGQVVRNVLLERADHTRQLIAPDRIAVAFGDAELSRNPTRFAEASVLLHVAMTAEAA